MSYLAHYNPPLYGEQIETIPVYTRNNDLSVLLALTFNAPFGHFSSMTWEGDYNRPYYKTCPNYIHPCTLEAAYHVASNLREEDLERL